MSDPESITARIQNSEYLLRIAECYANGMDSQQAKALNVKDTTLREDKKLTLKTMEALEARRTAFDEKTLARSEALRKLNSKADQIKQEAIKEHSNAVNSTRNLAKSAITKLKKVIQKVNTPHDGPDSRGEGIELQGIRRKHHSILLIMGEFDTLTEAIMYEREREVAHTHEISLKDSLQYQKDQLTAEYEKKIDHKLCQDRIAQLSADYSITKNDNERLYKQNSTLTEDLNKLKMNNCILEQEQAELLKTMTHRKHKIKIMAKKLALMSKMNMNDSKESPRKPSLKSSQLHTARPTSAYSMVSFKQTSNSDIESNRSESSFSDYFEEDWYKARPKWNNSTDASGILEDKRISDSAATKNYRRQKKLLNNSKLGKCLEHLERKEVDINAVKRILREVYKTEEECLNSSGDELKAKYRKPKPIPKEMNLVTPTDFTRPFDSDNIRPDSAPIDRANQKPQTYNNVHFKINRPKSAPFHKR